MRRIHLSALFGRRRAPAQPVQQGVREYLAARGLSPIVIERTTKRPGDLELVGAHKPAVVVK